MTSLVCIGHGKSGTTFLDRFFRHRTEVKVPLWDKEIKYFNQEDVSLDGYAKHFGLKSDDFLSAEFLSFEASPPYVTNCKRSHIERSLIRLRDTLPDPRILIAVRNPLKRAISHYAHTLYEISQRGFPPLFRDMAINYDGHPQPIFVKKRILNHPGSITIEDALSDRELCFSSYADCYELAVDILGVENVMIFWMEKDLIDLVGFVERLKRYFNLNFQYDHTPLPVALEGRGAPYYVYGGKSGCSVKIDGHSFSLYPKQLLIVRSEPCLLLDDVDKRSYDSLVAASQSWTLDVSKEYAHYIYNEFLREDYERFLALYKGHHKETPDDFYCNPVIEGKKISPARFEGSVSAWLKQEGHIPPVVPDRESETENG